MSHGYDFFSYGYEITLSHFLFYFIFRMLRKKRKKKWKKLTLVCFLIQEQRRVLTSDLKAGSEFLVVMLSLADPTARLHKII